MENLLKEIKRKIGEEEKIVVMYSGGMDSSLLIAALQNLGCQPIPVFFDDNSAEFNLRQMPAMTSFLQPRGLWKHAIGLRFPNTYQFMGSDELGYIPGYKMTMQVMAMAVAEGINSKMVATGYIHGDDAYADELEDSILSVTRTYSKIYTPISVVSPIRDFSKSDVVRLGVHLGVDFSRTFSCKDERFGGLTHCGECILCRKRRLGFKDAGVKDPTIYANG